MEDVQKINESFIKIRDEILKQLLSAGYVTGIIFIVIGLVLMMTEVLVFYKINVIDDWKVYRNAGKVIETYIETKSEIDGYGGFVLSNYSKILLYRTRIAFSYTINDIDYISYKYSYYEPWHNNPTITEFEQDSLKIGTVVDIIVNPDYPSEAYLTNKRYTHYDPIAIDIAIILIGAYIVYKSRNK